MHHYQEQEQNIISMVLLMQKINKGTEQFINKETHLRTNLINMLILMKITVLRHSHKTLDDKF